MTFIYAALYLLLVVIGAFLLNKYVLSRKNGAVEVNDALLSSEELIKHAEELGRKHKIISFKTSGNWLIKRMESNYKTILNVYKTFNSYVNEKKVTIPAAEWLLDNFYIIEQQVKEMKLTFTKKNYSRLPMLKEGSLKGYPRIYAIALELVGHTDGRFDEKLIIDFISSYQKSSVLSIRELWALSSMIRIALLENIRQLSKKIISAQTQLIRAEDLMNKVVKLSEDSPEDIVDIIEEDIVDLGIIKSTYAEYLLSRLKKMNFENAEITASILQLLDEKLRKQNTSAETIIRFEHQSQAEMQVSLGNSITSLRIISGLDWTDIFESLSQVEEILRKDPASIYLKMDFESRDYYRHVVEKIASSTARSETYIARKAVECGEIYKEKSKTTDKEKIAKKTHVGYYIIGKGKSTLEKRSGYKPSNIKKIFRTIKGNPLYIYILPISIATLGIIICLIAYAGFESKIGLFYSILLGLLLLIPTCNITTGLYNWLLLHLYKPSFIPKMEVKEEIPQDYSTLTVITTLLTSKESVNELVEKLEVYYLANKLKNIYYAILGDFKDSNEEINEKDSEIIELTRTKIKELNEKYAQENNNNFYYFHRKRKYIKNQKKWMGWERKRGALLELNNLLRGEQDTSFLQFDENKCLPYIKYVITLDADTNLIMGSAGKLIGTLLHPLNKPVVNKEKGVVESGYALIQPAIGINIGEANESIFSKLFAGQGGIDPYTTAVSDIYQDISGEGIYTGKGIYDVDVYKCLLNNAIPENAVLSHDLLEGSYLRTGLATDIYLIDGFPAKYNSYISRLHRWIRGDWQLLPWLMGSVRNKQGNRVKNPLNALSRWKILDNLKRSLISPAILILILAGLFILPKNPYIWIGYALLSVCIPLITTLIDYVITKDYQYGRDRYYTNVIFGTRAVLYQCLLLLIFLPFEGIVALDAIIRTVIRVLFTKKNMLEWTTAADVEKKLKNNLTGFIIRMKYSILTGIALIVLTIMYPQIFNNFGYIFGLLWIGAPFIAALISKSDKEKCLDEYSKDDIILLRKLSRKTWTYFEDFVNLIENYLPPDNYQVDPQNGVAHRTSPTNIGLYLLTLLSARDLGYIGLIDMAGRLEQTFNTIDRLSKWRGHLYNWYDTRTLSSLKPNYVSTVDSGNFVGYLITLEEGLKEYLNSPLLLEKRKDGLEDIYNIIIEENIEYDKDNKIKALFNKKLKTSYEWFVVLEQMKEIIKSNNIDNKWHEKFAVQVDSFYKDIVTIMPWLQLLDDSNKKENEGSFEEVRKLNSFSSILNNELSLKELCKKYEAMTLELDELDNGEDIEKFKKMLKSAYENTNNIISRVENIKSRIDHLVREMKFEPLYDHKRQLFSIGYSVDEDKLTKSYYDLLASEARLASLIAIGMGEIDKKHWFRLGRSLSSQEGYKGLVSWTGTMFEYFMPMLTVKSYKNTLWDETYWFVVKNQIKYGRQRKVPWGTSESAFYSFDMHLNYQYKALGVPALGLKRGLLNDMVVAPYSTLIALPHCPESAIENIKKLSAEGANGKYGLYEAIDYTLPRLPKGKKKCIVKTYMAHHQGMSLAALDNFLNNNILQERFHKNPYIKKVEILLQERVPRNVALTNENRDKIMPLEHNEEIEVEKIREYQLPYVDKIPETLVLSNNNYSILLTESGTGYSKKENIYINRWRNHDVVRSFGSFFYLRDIATNNVWTATYAPMFNIKPDRYKVRFLPYKADYIRRDSDIETHTEVTVSHEENMEIRKVTISNFKDEDIIIELTSYVELNLNDLNSDTSHVAFNKLFVRTEYLPDHKALIANRRPRGTEQEKMAVHAVLTDNKIEGELQYETDRAKFIGRGRNLENPAVLDGEHPLTGTVGAVLDPVFSLRYKLKIKANDNVTINFFTGYGESKKELIKMIDKYITKASIDRAFELSQTKSDVEYRYLNLKYSEKEIYEKLISYIIFPNKFMNKNITGMKNVLGQKELWKYGISGDLPIVTVNISKVGGAEIVKQLIKAHELWRMKGIIVDLVIINEDEGSYTEPLRNIINEIISASHARELMDVPGGVHVRNGRDMTPEEKTLIFMVSRLIFRGDFGMLSSQIAFDSRKGTEIFTNEVLPEKPYEKRKPEVEELRYYNSYGGFSNGGKEYVVYLDNNKNTPAPWSNVISNKSFGCIVTESGGGYTWAENSRENKLSIWSNDPVSDTQGEIFYLKDMDTKRVWSITPHPVRGQEAYVIRHGMGYSTFEHMSYGLEQKLTVFVDKDDPIKLNMIELYNFTSEKRNISLTFYLRPVLGAGEEIATGYVDAQKLKDNIIILENTYNTDFPGRKAFVASSEKEINFTCNRFEFLGHYGDLKNPIGLKKDKLTDSIESMSDVCVAMQVNITLEPDERKNMVFMYGQCIETEKIEQLYEKYKDVNNVINSLNEVKKYWDNINNVIEINTPDKTLDYMLNNWLLYQVLSCRVWGRTAYYQCGGAYGFRDQLQDVTSMLNIMPELANKQILLHAEHQFTDGDVQHWWHPLGTRNDGEGDRGIRTKYSDDLLWLPFVVAEYIEHTGDYGILDENAGYLASRLLEEDEHERYEIPQSIDEVGTVYDHCIRAIERSLALGKHGIPLFGSGDWCDGMNMVGAKGEGESVWLGWFIIRILDQFSTICKYKGEEDKVNKYIEMSKQISENIDKNGWDGNWYLRGYYDDGTLLGSSQNEECKIECIAQAWSVISKGGKEEKVKEAMKSLETYLINRDEGIILLLTPPFDKSEKNPGYIRSYVPGVRENGGQYTHAAMWAIIAFVEIGEGNKAWELFNMLNPINHGRTSAEVERYKVEPYVVAGDVYTNGRGGWTWYTGAAGWMFRAGLEYILGFKKKADKLVIDPCIPHKWDSFDIRYRYEDTYYNIIVKNPHGVSKGIEEVKLDGNSIEGNEIGLTNDKKEHKIEVMLG